MGRYKEYDPTTSGRSRVRTRGKNNVVTYIKIEQGTILPQDLNRPPDVNATLDWVQGSNTNPKSNNITRPTKRQ